jgi:hypothetical protein
MEALMKKLLGAAALLSLGLWASPPLMAQQSADCPAGQMRSADGTCMPSTGTGGATGTGTATGGTSTGTDLGRGISGGGSGSGGGTGVDTPAVRQMHGAGSSGTGTTSGSSGNNQ